MVIWSLMRSSALQQLIRMYAAGFYSDWQSISALFQADCFVRGLTLRSNNVVENLCMRPNIGPAAAGPAGPVATALYL